MSFDPCDNAPHNKIENLDKAQDPCFPEEKSLKDAILFDVKGQEAGFGHEANSCDPMMVGKLTQERIEPQRQVIYKYWKAIYGVNEAVTELFRDLEVIDINGESKGVPIMWATQERAVAQIINANVRQDTSLVVMRPKLPFLAIYSNNFQMNQSRYIYHGAIDYLRELRKDGKPGKTIQEDIHERDTIFGVARGIPVDVGYTLTAWTLYLEDMDQLLEQILRKFSPVAYIRVQGVNNWETIVKLESIANNLEVEPGDKQARVIKFQFNLTAETFIPQPIVRKKAVLKTKVDIVDAVSDEEITRVLTRLEDAVEGL